ncbi:MAG: hypothetical protein VYE73_12185 [Acidobacteriota bacterium]|nr:hypothetical protein [Acidobacteriota bacterium]
MRQPSSLGYELAWATDGTRFLVMELVEGDIKILDFGLAKAMAGR